MLYPPAFFGLQLNFASKLTQLTQHPYQEIILNMTALYRILGLDWSLNAQNPTWQNYLKGLHASDTGTDTDWSYQYVFFIVSQIE